MLLFAFEANTDLLQTVSSNSRKEATSNSHDDHCGERVQLVIYFHRNVLTIFELQQIRIHPTIQLAYL